MFFLTRTILLAVCLTVLSAELFVSAQEKRSNDLFEIKVNGKYGFIDRTGKVVIEPKFEGVHEFSEGLAVANFRGKFFAGFIDQSGKTVIEPQFDIASKFSDGLAWVGFDPTKTEYKIGGHTFYSGPASDSFSYDIGFIDRTGKFITEPIFSDARDFSEGLAAVKKKGDKTFGFIDRSGKFVLEPIYDWASSFSEGLAVVFVKGKYGFIDRTGKFVIQPIFTDASDFSEGIAYVKIGGRTREHVAGGSQTVTTGSEDRNFAYLDKTGKALFYLNADTCSPFHEGVANVEVNGQWGFINKAGKIALRPSIEVLHDFSEGLAMVLLANESARLGFIDKTGSVFLRTNYALVDDFRGGLAKVTEYDPEHDRDVVYERYGYIDRTGKVIWKPTR